VHFEVCARCRRELEILAPKNVSGLSIAGRRSLVAKPDTAFLFESCPEDNRLARVSLRSVEPLLPETSWSVSYVFQTWPLRYAKNTPRSQHVDACGVYVAFYRYGGHEPNPIRREHEF
jgi:hypothetical protein